MKKIALLMLLALPLIIISCEKEHSDPTISEETFPTILGQWPSGNPAVYNVTAGEDLTITLQFAPSQYTTGVWYLDDVKVGEGTQFSRTFNEPGSYKLRLEVSPAYHKTSRSANIEVTAETD